MPLFRSSKVIERQIDEFLDTVNEGALVFREAINDYLAGDQANFEGRIEQIDRLESAADDLSREVETELYRHSLIPQTRGDVLGLLEHTDDVVDTAKKALHQFRIERPDIPAALHLEFKSLAEDSPNMIFINQPLKFSDAASVSGVHDAVHYIII